MSAQTTTQQNPQQVTEGRRVPRYHAPRWDEPVVLEMGRPGRRGQLPPAPDPSAPALEELVPEGLRRSTAPGLPELSEFEVQRHYLHLSQMTLGMMGVSLFGTCTMKYNARVSEHVAARPELAELHPNQPLESLQGVLQIIHDFERYLGELSGMSRFVFQPGGGANAAYTHAVVTRAYHAARGELDKRTEVITTIQTHPCNAATAAAAGFDVITLPLGPNGYPTLESLEAAVSDRTAALMVGNPDDMGIYNPDLKRWVEIVHEAGGLCFYDSATFNGIMSRVRPRDLGFDACMFMLHKTFGAPKGGGGPAVGAYGCSDELVPFLPRPLVTFDGERYGLETLDEAPQSVGKVREFWGNVPVVVKAYAWVRALGAEGIRDAADLSVLANNYMDKRMAQVRGVERTNPGVTAPRLEMTRWSFERLREDTGVDVHDISHRMVDFGVDAPWLAHEPWLTPEPMTPEAGELWSKEDIDTWVDVVAHIAEEAYRDPETVRTAPHNQAIAKVDTSKINEPDQWATTWRAYRRKHGGDGGAASETAS